MDRRRFGKLLGAAIFLAAAPMVHAIPDQDDHGHGRDHGHHGGDHGHEHGHEERDDNDHDHGRFRGDGYFPSQDYGDLRRYYDGPRDLPPGLRKKYYRTGRLPPGWEKRFRPMPYVLVQRLPPVPPYYERGYLDGYAVVIDPRTRVVIDAIDIVGALTGH